MVNFSPGGRAAPNGRPAPAGQRRRPVRAAEPAAAEACALRLLLRRPLSVAELSDRLLQRGYESAAAAAALAKMRHHGYLDDAALASNLAQGARRTGRGPRWAQRKLQQRALEPAAADAALAATFDDPAAQVDQAAELLRRRFFRAPPPTERLALRRLQQRALRFLLGRGFGGAAATAALHKACAAPPDDDQIDPPCGEDAPW